MKIFVYGHERKWVSELQRLFRRDQIELCEAASRDIKLAVTDFPVSKMRKGIFAKIPFLVVSREKREEKILEAFEMGAEDYMVYPVSPKIARARILRIVKHYGIEEYLEGLKERVHFTPNEYRVLSFLMACPGKVFSRNEVLEGAFAEEYEGYDRNIDNYVKQIRKKLKQDAGKRDWIETVYGVGYRFMP